MGIVVNYLSYSSLTIHSTNTTDPIQPTYGSVSKFPKSCVNSSLYRFLQFAFSFNSPKPSYNFSLATSFFSVQDSAPYVATGLVECLTGF